MRFCYIDESGTEGDTPYVVFAGLLFDRTKRAKVTRESRGLVEEILGSAARAPVEIKSHHLYPGKQHWKGVKGRSGHIDRLCDWFVDKSGGRLALSAIDATDHKSSSLHSLIGLDVWTAGALHIALQIQKTGKPSKNNKGQSVLVFDEQRVRQEGLTELLISGPEFTDDYYGRKSKDEPFDQVIDTPLFAASHHLPLLQVADVFAYVIRQYIEVSEGHRPEGYAGEAAVLNAWCEKLSTRLLDSAADGRRRQSLTSPALTASLHPIVSAPDCPRRPVRRCGGGRRRCVRRRRNAACRTFLPDAARGAGLRWARGHAGHASRGRFVRPCRCRRTIAGRREGQARRPTLRPLPQHSRPAVSTFRSPAGFDRRSRSLILSDVPRIVDRTYPLGPNIDD